MFTAEVISQSNYGILTGDQNTTAQGPWPSKSHSSIYSSPNLYTVSETSWLPDPMSEALSELPSTNIFINNLEYSCTKYNNEILNPIGVRL